MARRSNAREAKIALRRAALAEDLKPVHPGESGGQFKPLTPSDIEQIEATVYRILEEVGFADAKRAGAETRFTIERLTRAFLHRRRRGHDRRPG